MTDETCCVQELSHLVWESLQDSDFKDAHHFLKLDLLDSFF